VGVLAGELAHLLLDRGHPRHPADEDDVLHPAAAGVGEGLLDRCDDPLEQLGGEFVQLRPRQLHLEVLRVALDSGDERKADLRLLRRRELDLRLLRRLVEPLQRPLVGGEIDALVALELGDYPLDDRLVPVVAAEVVVTGGRLHLEHALAELEH
jgi:hypothetical protein